MSCVLAGSAEFRESDVGQAWVRRQLKRGDIFVTRSKTPYELDWKSPVGEELDFIIVHLAVDQFLAALEAANLVGLLFIPAQRDYNPPERATGFKIAGSRVGQR